MRPARRYEIHFTHPDDPQPVKLIAVGTTPCNAKDRGFDMLQQLLKLEPERPQDGWRKAFQEDRGLYEG